MGGKAAAPEFLELKKDIRALLLSVKDGLTPSELERDYRAMLGKPMPFRKFGHDSVLDLVKAIPDVVLPNFRAGGILYLKGKSDASTAHIERFVLQQKNTSKVSRIRPSIGTPAPRPTVPHRVRIRITELMKSYPSGLNACMFLNAYTKRFGEELNYKGLGFGVLKGFLAECKDIITLQERGTVLTIFLKEKCDIDDKRERHTKSSSAAREMQNDGLSKRETTYRRNERLTSSSSLEEPEGMTKMSKVTSARSGGSTGLRVGISKQLQDEIAQIMEKKPNGIWSARLPFEYEQLHKKVLDVQSVGFRSIIELAGSLPHIIRIERPAPESDWLLFSADMVICKNEILPKFAAFLEDTYKDGAIELDGDILLTVVHVQDPLNFWFRPNSWEQDHLELMRNLQKFYSSKDSERYRFPETYRRPGQVCCALYEEDGSWYRAEVLGVKSANETEVLYVDYGNASVVSSLHLRLLSRDFLSNPRQCLKGTLWNVRPAKLESWSVKAIDYFYELTSERKLFGACKGKVNESVSLELIDTNTDEDIYINTLLVVKGYASYITLPEKPKSTLATQKCSPGTQKGKGILKGSPETEDAAVLGHGSSVLNCNTMNSQMNNYWATYYAYSLVQMQAQLAQLQSSMLGVTQQGLLQPGLQTNGVQQPSQQVGASSQIPFLPQVPLSSMQTKHTSPSQAFATPFNQTLHSTSMQASKSSSRQAMHGLASPRYQNKPDVVPIEHHLRNAESLDKEQTTVRVKRLCLPGEAVLHVIKNESVPIVTSAELSSLLSSSRNGDNLRGMLRQKKANFSKYTLQRSINEDLFAEMDRMNVKGLQENGKLKDFVNFYAFESSPDILALFAANLEEVINVLRGLKEKVKDPDFWESPEFHIKGDVTEDGSGSHRANEDEIESDSEDLELELEELKLQEQALHFRRKRLYNHLITGKATDEKVEDLKAVEEQLETIRALIKVKSGGKP